MIFHVSPRGFRAIVTRAFLPVKSLQDLDQEWSSYLTSITALQKPGGFAYVKLGRTSS